jgi:hypothetical protein
MKRNRRKKSNVAHAGVADQPDLNRPFRELYYYSLILRIISDIHMGKLPAMLRRIDSTIALSNHLIHDVCTTQAAKDAIADMQRMQNTRESK